MKTILVIDDNKEILENTSELVGLMGYKVLSTEFGSEGIAIAKSTKIDLIICDIKMCGTNGYEVLMDLSLSSRTKSIPFLFMTALADPAQKKYGLELGAAAYLIKPFDENQLLSAIEGSLKRSILSHFKLSMKTYFRPVEESARFIMPYRYI